jgi:hypothetical protein
MRFRRQLSLIVLVFGFTATSALAQTFYWTAASARSVALGGVYVPSSSDAVDALATNAAGLTYLSCRTLSLNLNTVLARGSFSNSVNTAAPLS